MKLSNRVLQIVLLIIIVSYSSKSQSQEIEKTATGFYWPTGTESIGNYAGWIANNCDWDPPDTYLTNEGIDLYHIGWDIAASEGSSVYAISDGKVINISENGWGNGNIGVVVEHRLEDGSRFISIYGHVISDVKEDDKLPAGKPFASIGYWPPPHLHFGIRPGSSTNSPYGAMSCPAEGPITDTNGFVNPIQWIESKAPFLLHQEQGDPTIYQLRTDGEIERLWPIFHGKVLIALAGSVDPPRTIHQGGSFKNDYLVAPRLGQIGTLYQASGDTDVWFVYGVELDDSNSSLGQRIHAEKNLFDNGLLQWGNVLTMNQAFIESYGLVEDNEFLDYADLEHFIGMKGDGDISKQDKFLPKYKEYSDDKLGYPFDNGGGIVVHEEQGVWIQDFKQFDLTQPHFGEDGETALMLNPQGTAVFLVKEGFWGWYKTENGFVKLGAPLRDEYDENGVKYQDFEGGRLKWDGSPVEPVALASVSLHIAREVGGDPGEATIWTIKDDLFHPNGVSIDNAGNLYIADTENHRVFKRSTTGNITLFAGNGEESNGGDGDGGQATEAKLAYPTSTSIDGAGNVYILDHARGDVRKVDTSGIISTVINSGLSGPAGLFVDDAGRIYVADTKNQMIRKYDSTGGNMAVVAGNGTKGFAGDGERAAGAQLTDPHFVFVDGTGNIFIADSGNDRIRKVDTAGIITTVAGSGETGEGLGGFSGDGGQATNAGLNAPIGVFVDGNGQIFIADRDNHRIRKVDTTGIITTVAGSGEIGEGAGGYSGDGGLATSAELSSPRGVAVEADGTIYIADTDNNRIREVLPITEPVESPEFLLTALETNYGDVLVGNSGNLNFDIENPGSALLTIRSISSENSGFSISPNPPYYISPTSVQNVTANFEPAKIGTTTTRLVIAHDVTEAPVYLRLNGVGLQPIISVSTTSLDFGEVATGNLVQRILRIANTGNAILTVSDISASGTNSDLFSVSNSSFNLEPEASQQVTVTFTPISAIPASATLSIQHNAEGGTNEVNLSGTGVATEPDPFEPENIETIAGNGTPGYSGDEGAATQAQLNLPFGMAIDANKNIYIADRSNSRVRRIGSDGVITTFAGTGVNGFSGDEGPAIQAQLYHPSDVAVDADGSIYIADAQNKRIRRVGTDGIIRTFAGSGESGGSNGDGGQATLAQLTYPNAIYIDANGNIYISDSGQNNVRRVGTDGIITTVAGTGINGYSGDGGLATEAQLNAPLCVAVDANGNIYIADQVNHRVRCVDSDGIITTVAGTGTADYSGDEGPANLAMLNTPTGVAVDASGRVYISDSNNDRIRRIGTDGIIRTIAGTGEGGFSGDGGLATQAQLNEPYKLVLDTNGDIYFADGANHRIRRIGPVSVDPPEEPISAIVELSDTTVTYQETISIPVHVTDATDQGIWAASIYITIAGNGRVAKVTGIETTGTMIEGWTTEHNIVAGADGIDTLMVSAATEDSPLTGTGILFNMIFEVQDIRHPDATQLDVVRALFNEEDRTAESKDGSLTLVGTDGSVDISPVGTEPIEPGKNATITVIDADENRDDGASEQIRVQVVSIRCEDSESVTLTESQSGTFTGDIQTVYDQTCTSGNDLLELTAADTAIAVYVDSLDSEGATVTRKDSTAALKTGTDGVLWISRVVQAKESSNGLRDTVRIELVDPDLNTDENVIEQVSVILENKVNNEVEHIILDETETNSEVFQRRVSTSFGTSGTDDNSVITISAQDSMLVSYKDILNSQGPEKTVTAKGYVINLFGDISENGFVTAYDAALILRIRARLLEADRWDSLKADVSGIGLLTGYDASLILMHDVHKIFRFPIQTGIDIDGTTIMNHSSHPFLKPLDEQYMISFGEVIGQDDGTFWVPVELSERRNIVAGSLDIAIGQAVRVEGAFTAVGYENYLIEHNVIDGELKLDFAGVEPVDGGQGPVVWIQARPVGEDGAWIKFSKALLNERLVTIASGEVELTSAPIVPREFVLLQNFPNPFNSGTVVPYHVASETQVVMTVFNLAGQRVRILVDDMLAPGAYQVAWDGTDDAGRPVTSGVYLYQVRAGDFSATKKMILLK